MSVKPLDLQVNMNSTISISKIEGERQAQLSLEQKNQETANKKDALHDKESVKESNQSEKSENDISQRSVEERNKEKQQDKNQTEDNSEKKDLEEQEVLPEDIEVSENQLDILA